MHITENSCFLYGSLDKDPIFMADCRLDCYKNGNALLMVIEI